jgi:hypothetical protein
VFIREIISYVMPGTVSSDRATVTRVFSGALQTLWQEGATFGCMSPLGIGVASTLGGAGERM